MMTATNSHQAAVAKATNMLETTDGLRAAQQLAKSTDQILQALYKQYLTSDFVVMAAGGYGNGRLAPHSDIDVLILQPSADKTAGVREFINACWDTGLKLSHMVHTVETLSTLLQDDHISQTAVLTHRYLAGSKTKYKKLLNFLTSDIFTDEWRGTYIQNKLDERNTRHEKAGTARFAVEPDVKSGPGALRDLQTLQWVAKALDQKTKTPLANLLDPSELRLFKKGEAFLWTVRFHMHKLTNHAQDRLGFDIQPRLARAMGYGDGTNADVQRLMQRYFWTAQQIRTLTRIVCTRIEDRHQSEHTKPKVLLPGFLNKNQRLLAVDHSRLDTADKLIAVFNIAAGHGLDIHPNTLSHIAQRVRHLKPAERKDANAVRGFLTLLNRGPRAMPAIRLMHEVGMLGWFLPEFRRITGMSQFDMHHAYTVDEHTLRALQTLLDIEAGKRPNTHPLTTDVFHQISDNYVLKLAVLLHDTGKGQGDQLIHGARLARRAARRLGLPKADAKRIAWLVEHHIFMSEVAQKRDIQDPATVQDFANVVKTPNRLRQLFVLTVVDMQAVGPQVWNSWKGSLLSKLYTETLAHFRGSALADTTVDFALTPGVTAHKNIKQKTTEIRYVGQDTPGLMARVGHVMARHGASVVAARVQTVDGQAVDQFWIQNGRGQAFGHKAPYDLEQLLTALRAGDMDSDFKPLPPPPVPQRVQSMPISPVVTFDDTASERCLVIEVSGLDRPGLLSEIAYVLSEHGLDIRSAHIDNYGPRAVDVFYVEHNGQYPNMSMNARAALKNQLVQTLEAAHT